MGLLRKKDKRNKSNRTEEHDDTTRLSKQNVQDATAPPQLHHRNSPPDYDARKIEDVDSGGAYNKQNDPYSPSGGTSASSAVSMSMSGESATKSTFEKQPTSNKDGRGPWFTSRQIRLFRKPPPAEQAAYTGPPRYDWVDIVSCLDHFEQHIWVDFFFFFCGTPRQNLCNDVGIRGRP